MPYRTHQKDDEVEVITLGKPNVSLNLDHNDTEQQFSSCLIKILETCNMPEEEKRASAAIIQKHASENLLTKHKLRNDSLGPQKTNHCYFSWRACWQPTVAGWRHYLRTLNL